jgi:hypothetical protein
VENGEGLCWTTYPFPGRAQDAPGNRGPRSVLRAAIVFQRSKVYLSLSTFMRESLAPPSWRLRLLPDSSSHSSFPAANPSVCFLTHSKCWVYFFPNRFGTDLEKRKSRLYVFAEGSQAQGNLPCGAPGMAASSPERSGCAMSAAPRSVLFLEAHGK